MTCARDSAPGGTGPTRLVFGAVANVRALRSRSLTQVLIEVPDEHHVALTNLLHSQNVILMDAGDMVEQATPYGPLTAPTDGKGSSGSQPESGSANRPSLLRVDTPSAVEPKGLLVHGFVSLVRAAPSRGVSVAHVDLPEDCHVEATRRFFGRDVLVLPCRLPAGTPYGVVNGMAQITNSTGGLAQATTPSSPAKPSVHRTGLQSAAPEAELQSRWVRRLAMYCSSPAFQGWLGVADEHQARAVLLQRLGADSRRQIAADPGLRQRFLVEFERSFKRSSASTPMTPSHASESRSSEAPDRTPRSLGSQYSRPRL